MQGTVLITGSSTGFGEATARLFAARGWNVAATMRDPSSSAALTKLNNVLVTRLDVQDLTSIGNAIDETIGRFGRIDVVVNNAGFGLFGIFEATSREKVAEQFDVNVFGVMDVTRAVLPHLRKNRAGVIVNISSGGGVFALPMISLYCASKFAIEGFSEALSYELGSIGVRVKIVEPGGVINTSFGKRSGQEAAQGDNPPEYAEFLTAANEVFVSLRASRGNATSEEVAEVIFEAATDGTDKLRYVATEDIKPMVAARRETSENAYMEFMRDQVAPKINSGV